MAAPGHEPVADERYLGAGPARLYVREIGRGVPIIVVHGGPDLDHEYLLPDMDRLAESFRLVYYDQRGRGRSFSNQAPDGITLTTEIEDLDGIRESCGFEAVAVLGHSWGGLLALEYAIRLPHRVSHLILMNTAPVSHGGVLALREALQRGRSPEQSERMSALVSDPRYDAGDLDLDLEYYRIHFGSTLRSPEQLDGVIARLRSAFTSDSIVTARAIEGGLYRQTWDGEDYDLIPRLDRLRIPSLVIHGDDDLVPVDVARHVADAIPGRASSSSPTAATSPTSNSPTACEGPSLRSWRRTEARDSRQTDDSHDRARRWAPTDLGHQRGEARVLTQLEHSGLWMLRAWGTLMCGARAVVCGSELTPMGVVTSVRSGGFVMPAKKTTRRGTTAKPTRVGKLQGAVERLSLGCLATQPSLCGHGGGPGSTDARSGPAADGGSAAAAVRHQSDRSGCVGTSRR